jgi:hypothetical protein
MSVTILTTSYKRPMLLERLGEVIVPLINKLDGELKWKITVDDTVDTDAYKLVFKKIVQKIKNRDFITWNFQDNIGKFKSLIKLLNEDLDTQWLVNIDDDDIIINYKFEEFLKKLNSIDKDVNAILVPRLILNIRFYNFKFKKKKKLFSKFNNVKMSYFDFKNKFGDIDSTIFLRKSNYKINHFPEIGEDNFTAESLLWLQAFSNNDLLLVNEYLIYSQYLAGGLTKSTKSKRVSNSTSAIVLYKKFLEYRKFSMSKIYIKSLINYYRFNLHAKNKINITKDDYANLGIRFLSLIFAKLMFFYDNLIVKGKS